MELLVIFLPAIIIFVGILMVLYSYLKRKQQQKQIEQWWSGGDLPMDADEIREFKRRKVKEYCERTRALETSRQTRQQEDDSLLIPQLLAVDSLSRNDHSYNQHCKTSAGSTHDEGGSSGSSDSGSGGSSAD